ncbi:hypothetical protein [Elioraea sp.]|uniref:hypothetical protein n=1 Tax=Elioraea sp. TaxID=2185103 RepID=UPI0025B8052E|nr:hypothetical protein [Elioraea sp.]
MSDAPQTLTVVIPLSVKKRGGRKAIITPGVLEIERRQDITLIKAVARAFRWRRMLEEGRFATLTELAAAEKINRTPRITVCVAPGPFWVALDDQRFSAAGQHHGMSSSMRLLGHPLTRRVSTSVK